MKSDMLSQGERYFREERTATFRKEEFTYTHTGIIDEDGEMWTTTELDEANMYQVYNQYRERHGIPFPDEIAGLRQHYGISAAKMSLILGFGINQYRMYEDGEVPSISNARTIIAARDKAMFMSFVEASKADLTEAEYSRICKKVNDTSGDFAAPHQPTIYTGYRSLSMDKVAAVGHLLISKLESVFVTKMNKLMFYVDFINYKRHGYGITGLTYRALQYGPVPESWGMVYSSIPGVAMEEFVYPSGQSGIMLELQSQTDSSALSEEEIETVETVGRLFSTMNAGEISEISHKENAWINNNKNHGKISYNEAFTLLYD